MLIVTIYKTNHIFFNLKSNLELPYKFLKHENQKKIKWFSIEKVEKLKKGKKGVQENIVMKK